MASTGDNSKAALIEALNGALADHLALYLKTKNFHWHVKGPNFRSRHLLFDEQAAQIFGLVDVIAERVRKIGGKTLTSIGTVGKTTNIADQDDTELSADAMVEELRDDNRKLLERLKQVKKTSDEAGDNATNGMVDDWIDQAEERAWFLTETIS
ncbi:DNA starvation/stationary phase protection protein [Altererythrobacter sp. B11]|uniref:Dps family protein n=1 Tax=Altererythrobacter sp. B11 TaxID=2060312 RepID=UPI000DC71D64|nr:DNA starvation/stationary phase protection protein [Altererythrobacter sp. B11]BBC74367.1 DNA starvation/stationary phase protection protein [Altererythrobacter sp. B11]